MVAIINTCCTGSTGRIAVGFQRYLLAKGKDAVMCYGRGPASETANYKFCSQLEVYCHYFWQHLTGQLCVGSRLATKRLVRFLKKNNVNEVCLINLHGYYLNEKILFDYLCENDVKVIYIMADESACWGNCTYSFGCEKYRNECIGCANLKKWQRRLYGEVSHKAFKIKQSAYGKLNATFVAPEYVINAVRQSPLLKDKRLEIVDEAINVTISTPRNTKDLKKQLGISDDKIVITCVAPYSTKYARKGVSFFVEAARRFEGDNRFVFVQVGYMNGKPSELPSNYIPIGFIEDAVKLSYYYSLGDLFVFPSLVDTMPNACLEALACGTPLLCFNISGMPYLGDESVMTLVEARNVEQMVQVISNTTKKTPEQINICRNYALMRYDSKNYFEKLYTIMNRL